MSQSKRIGVFVAWPYANGDLHVGHAAGALLPADIFARFHRLSGNRVLMVSGSDCHGTPITVKAIEENTTPAGVVERYHHRFLEAFSNLGISFDLYTMTYTENHYKTTQRFFTKLHEQGDLFVAAEKQFFDEASNLFLPDRYVRGTCPHCNYERARGDQCENCGSTLDPVELKNPVSLLSKTTPVLRETEHFFFDLSRYEQKLREYLSTKDFWRAHVINFTQAMLEAGLKPRPITRDITWGVPVPLEGWENKVMYVWFDAVIGYLSGSLEWAGRKGTPDAWREWWQGPNADGYYFIGKDNIPFHTVVWPIELLAVEPELNLPCDVPANQFLNVSGEKLSTSGGNAVWLPDALARVDADCLRYYLTSIMPETKDSSFSWEELMTKNNGELVAAWGNLVNRVFGFAHSRYQGQVPQPQALDERDKGLLAELESGVKACAEFYSAVRLRDALKEAFRVTREVNKYLDEKAPWTVFKTDPVAAGTTIFVAFRAIDTLKVMFAPVLPFSSQSIHRALGYSEPLFGDVSINRAAEETRSHEVLEYSPVESEREGVNRFVVSSLAAGTPFEKAPPLFKVLESV